MGYRAEQKPQQAGPHVTLDNAVCSHFLTNKTYRLLQSFHYYESCFLVYVSYQKQRSWHVICTIADIQITLHSVCTNIFILIGPYCTLPTFDNVQETSLTFANLMSMKWHFKVALSFHVPDDSEAKQLFMYLWAMGQWISLLISKLVWTPILNLRI